MKKSFKITTRDLLTAGTGLLAGLVIMGLVSGPVRYSVTNGDQKLVTFKNGEITSDDVFNKIMESSSAAGFVLTEMDKMILEQEFPTDATIKKDAETAYTELMANLANYNTTEEQFMKQYGYKTKDDVMNVLIMNTKTKLVVENYINDHKDALIKDYVKNNDPKLVSHILVKDKAEADAIYDQVIKDPSVFAQVAQTKSIDEQSAKAGGSLGLVTNSTEFVPEFKAAVKTLKQGKISKPVKSEYGYHIIYVTSTNTKDMETDIMTELKKDQSLSNKALDELRAKYDVKYTNDNLKKLIDEYITSLDQK